MPAPIPENLMQTPFTQCYPKTVDEWVDVFGFALPLSFGDPEAEYHAVRNAAAVMEFSLLNKWDIQGPGALETVNKVYSRDVSALASGQIAYGVVTDDQGLMLDDCTINFYGPEHIRVYGVNPEVEASLRRNLTPGTTMTDLRADFGHMSVQGPKSREILQGMTTTDLSNAALPYYHFLTGVDLAGIPVQVSRMGFTAELGYEILVDADQAVALWDALFEAGRDYGLMAAGSATVMTARVEAGMMMGELEYDNTVTPYDCRLGWAVDLDKADFQGRAALITAKESSARTVVSIVLSGEGDFEGAPLMHDGNNVGHITMALPSPFLNGKFLGLCRLQRCAAKIGTVLALGGDHVGVTAEVVRTPVYDPERKRVRS